MCSIKVVLTKYGPVPKNTAGKGKRCRISSSGWSNKIFTFNVILTWIIQQYWNADNDFKV